MIYYTLEDFKNSYNSNLELHLNSYVDNSEIEFLTQLKKDYQVYIKNVTLISILNSIDTISRFQGSDLVEEIERKIFLNNELNVVDCKKYFSSFSRIIEFIDERIIFKSNFNRLNNESKIYQDELTDKQKIFIKSLLDKGYKYSHVYRSLLSENIISITEKSFLSFLKLCHPEIKVLGNRISVNIKIREELKNFISEFKNQK